MEKKSQVDLGGIITLVLFVVIAVPLLGALFSALGAVSHNSECAPEIAQVADLSNQINAVKAQASVAVDNYNTCANNYNELIKTNITKQDFTDIQNTLENTNLYINNINSKLDLLQNQSISFNKTTIYNFNLSLALNFILSLEVLSFVFVKNEFLQWIWSITFGRKQKHHKAKQEPEEKKED